MNTSKGTLTHLNTEGVWPSFILSDANDCIPNVIRTRGSWELDLINDAKRYIKDDSIVLDIGANIGAWSVYIAMNKSLTIHSFEPYLPTYYNLCSNLLVNEAFNCNTHRCALGSKEEYGSILPLYTCHGNVGATRINDNNVVGSGFDKTKFNAAMDYLDRIFPTEHVSFIKIDVEGHEEKVLRGGEQLLKRSKPVIFFEAWNHRPDIRDSLIKYITSLGYNVEHIKDDDYKALPQ